MWLIYAAITAQIAGSLAVTSRNPGLSTHIDGHNTEKGVPTNTHHLVLPRQNGEGFYQNIADGIAQYNQRYPDRYLYRVTSVNMGTTVTSEDPSNPLKDPNLTLIFSQDASNPAPEHTSTISSQSHGTTWDAFSRSFSHYQWEPLSDLPFSWDDLQNQLTIEEAVHLLSQIQPNIEKNVQSYTIELRPSKGLLADTLPLDIYYSFSMKPGNKHQFVYIGAIFGGIYIDVSRFSAQAVLLQSLARTSVTLEAGTPQDDLAATINRGIALFMANKPSARLTIIHAFPKTTYPFPTDPSPAKFKNVILKFDTSDPAQPPNPELHGGVEILRTSRFTGRWLPRLGFEQNWGEELQVLPWENLRHIMSPEDALHKLDAVGLRGLKVSSVRITARTTRGVLSSLPADIYYEFVTGDLQGPLGAVKLVYVGVLHGEVFVNPTLHGGDGRVA